jgi:hypothetical protein
MKLSVLFVSHDFLVILLMYDTNKLAYHYDISCGETFGKSDEEWKVEEVGVQDILFLKGFLKFSVT